ncbi:sigma-70 family RNA polymerase sigma factor [Ochrobactrum sp. RH2CCR150]|uniref:sigma-70 family RNA polymerase sigma factor n=1 Tax=Ochrobactrum sp. RH2CCR150 TaxID=2587044 RepID=UPI0015FD99DC|nr:RNA polymerase sigma-70 factor (ECF subfamily) [Ochrobactrum sp. RH2CCR150]
MSTNNDFESELLQLLPALHSFAKTMCRQPTDADDLVQETLFKALRSQDKYVPFGTLKSWLFTIMKNTFCSKIRRARREVPVQEWEGPTIGPSQEWAMELQDVGRSIVRLSQQHQDVIKLVILNGLSYEDAAIEAGCTIGTIKSRLNRARHQLLGDKNSS